MRVKCFTSSDMGENCYIVAGDNKEAVIIDPGNVSLKVADYIRKEGYSVKYILQTHCHFDHMCSADELKLLTGAEILVHEAEAELCANPTYNLSQVFGMGEEYKYDRTLKHGDKIEFGGTYCRVIHTPGHTQGGCCFLFEQEAALFSGDTLFYASVGRSDFPTGDEEILRLSIIKRLFVLPDETKVFSGHGQPTTIGFEKNNNPYVF